MKNLFRSVLRSANKPDPRQVLVWTKQINHQYFYQRIIVKHVVIICVTFALTCMSAIIVDYNSLVGVNKDFGVGIQKDFNDGYLMKVNLNNLKCICGKQLQFHNLNHAMCAACGLASCSDQCHHQWQKKGNCTYHTNFYEFNFTNNLRSIRFSNILNIQKSKIKRWNIAQKTSLSYISCYVSKITDYVYLQRGFRNYGKPQPDLLTRFEKIPFGLDFATHIQRVCQCTCPNCVDRSIHSVGNCEYSCTNSIGEQADSYSIKQEYHYQCKCTCEFCQSGIIIDSHRALDCLAHCYKSELKNIYG